jgi:hypothetical protein
MGDMSHTHDTRSLANNLRRLNSAVTRFLLDSGFARSGFASRPAFAFVLSGLSFPARFDLATRPT